jgi:hypothetical protein
MVLFGIIVSNPLPYEVTLHFFLIQLIRHIFRHSTPLAGCAGRRFTRKPSYLPCAGALLENSDIIMVVTVGLYVLLDLGLEWGIKYALTVAL